ncbi:Acetolactate synthase isozyme 2 large subunit [Achromobacter denitrificans]|uniref:thiamine pyrophosphate-dependent enzyme n=1 Tax=Achromobacter denitrificans TaxID=32002 RepID=UPI000788E86A|nr:thiamine pyrophosphate-dependent enzyme [Achromobacter denitrificans]OLU03395.1 pyruvate decarboxylase [Achromobacter denitrificans]QKH41070.1 pyruvate decarboxylase [Achromobacter denitrificans]QKH51785.1 pyruvate decarboxylase [Achromobacter denitrificans]CAB3739304.1 Acetolactate synthase isozyme 2 large subunit [Achromobacter denitrificans]SUU28273.1 Acetolactate synthase isozyme 2 large subunit [Achromobacter denitrificans]
MTPSSASNTSAHALLKVFAANGIDRVFVVPGESYLGVLDALHDFPGIDVVTCRHEGGAGFMACADGKLTGRPGVAMVSRGPGAANAAIGVHAAQQDGVPMILLIGQVPARDLRKEAFQEIDYQKMYGAIAKWVHEVARPEDLAWAALKALRVATSGTPGPVVLVVPEDVQQAAVPQPDWAAEPASPTQPAPAALARLQALLSAARKPLIIAGGGFNAPGGREALRRLAERHGIPVAVSFRQHDLFPNTHALYAGDLDLATQAAQVAAFDSSDLILALGTRLGDITTQGYAFPGYPRPSQTLVHCHPDAHVVNQHFTADVGLVADPVATALALAELPVSEAAAARSDWAASLRAIRERAAAWPSPVAEDGVPFVSVVRALAEQAPSDLMVCLDAGTFAAPVYRHFPFAAPQRLMASQSGAMGYGTPAAIVSQLRFPSRKVVCLVGDGGFMMTGNEMIAAAERGLPVFFIVSNNNCYGSIRLHQARTYPGRYTGTSLASPDFTMIARAFGMRTERVTRADQVAGAVARGLASTAPCLVEVKTSLGAILPAGVGSEAGVDLLRRGD